MSRPARTSPLAAVVAGATAHPLLTILLVVLLAVLGLQRLTGLPKDVYPDLTLPIFNLITQNPAMSVEEMEIQVSLPMERAFQGLPSIRKVRSLSTQGISVVMVEFDSEMDYWRARQFVAERVSQILPQLPADTEPPIMGSLSSRLSEILIVTLEGDDLKEVRDTAEYQVRLGLLAVPGVSQVFTIGGHLRQYEVRADAARLNAFGLALHDLEEALAAGSHNASGGFLTAGGLEYPVRAVGRAAALRDLEQAVVTVAQGVPVLVRDLARVVDGAAVRRGVVTRNGREAVNCIVVKQFGADTTQVSMEVRQALRAMAPQLPSGMVARVTYDQSNLIIDALSHTALALLLGAGLVILVILVFLGNLRATLVVAASLPLTVALAGGILSFCGQSLNTMTLGGLAIAIGILVDASIIMLENIFLRLHERSGDRMTVVLEAAREVATPITVATLIIIGVFAPLWSFTGIEGRLFRPLGLAVSAAMFVALVLSLTLTPVLASLVVQVRPGAEAEVPLVAWLKRRYQPILAACMAHGRLTMGITAGVTAGVLALALTLGTAFMPALDEGAIELQTYLPTGTSLAESDRINHLVDQALVTLPDATEVVRQTGRAEKSEDPMPVTLSDIQVSLAPRGQRTLDSKALLEEVRRRLAPIPGIRVSVTTPLQMRIEETLSGTNAAVSIRLSGHDMAALRAQAERLEAVMADLPGIADLRIDQPEDQWQVQVRVNRLAAARYGLTADTITKTVQTAIGGTVVGTLVREERLYDVVLRLDEPYRNRVGALEDLRLPTPAGALIPLREVARVQHIEGPTVIRREDGKRRIAVEANLAGADLGGTVARIKAAAARVLPPGSDTAYGGQYRQQQVAFRALLGAVALAVAIMFVLLLIGLGSTTKTGLILITLPVALVGGVLALAVTGETLNVSSGVGFIALMGIAVQNGLVLFTQIEQARAGGLSLMEAVAGASVRRMRPILMTALCAILGFLPVAILAGAELERPLAIVMIGGMVSSTAFVLLVLPVLYPLADAWRARARRRLGWQVTGEHAGTP